MWIYLAVASVMHPETAVRTRWDVYILILILVLCLVTPYAIGFDLEPRNDSIIGVLLLQSGPAECMVVGMMQRWGSLGAETACIKQIQMQHVGDFGAGGLTVLCLLIPPCTA